MSVRVECSFEMVKRKRKDRNAQALGRKRWKGISFEQRSQHGKLAVKQRQPPADPKIRADIARNASRAFWDSMTPEQRSAEMKRRAAKRRKKKS